MNKQIYEIDGSNFSTLDEFWEEISGKLIPGADWGRNLDAFNDILRGGFGTPENGFVLIWENSALSRQRLSFSETAKILEKRLLRCHPSNIETVKRDLDRAKKHHGQTAFDWLVEIIQGHKDIELRLE
jgi:RNAse (barnase) inhibitor barstar